MKKSAILLLLAAVLLCFSLQIAAADTGAITLETNGGALPSHGVPSRYTYGEAAAYPLPIPTRAGYVFNGWYTDPALTGSTVGSVEIHADTRGDLAYYASFSPVYLHTGFEDKIPTGINAKTSVFSLLDGVMHIEKNGPGASSSDGRGDCFIETSNTTADQSGIMTVEVALAAVAGKDVPSSHFRFRAANTSADTPILTVQSDGTVYVGSSAENVLGTLGETLQHFAVRVDFNTLTLDAYLDGQLVLAGVAFSSGLTPDTVKRANWYFGNETVGEMLMDDYAISAGAGFVYTEETGATVTLVPGGGELAEELRVYSYGTETVLPIPTYPGYEFFGWYDNGAYTGEPVRAIGAHERGNRTYYALWKQAVTLTVTPEGGEPSRHSAYVGDLFTLPDLAADLAWCDLTVRGGAYYHGGASLTVTHAHELTVRRVQGAFADGATVLTDMDMESETYPLAPTISPVYEGEAGQRYLSFRTNAAMSGIYRYDIAADDVGAGRYAVELSLRKSSLTFPVGKISFFTESEETGKTAETVLLTFTAAGELRFGASADPVLVTLSDSEWTRISLIYDIEEKIVIAYVNGRVAAARSVSAGDRVTEAFSLYIPKSQTNRGFCLDDLRVSSGAVEPFLSETVGGMVRLDPKGGTLTGETDLLYTYGESTPLPTPTLAGCTFLGWCASPDMTGDAVTSLSSEARGYAVLYAKWSFALTFDGAAASHSAGQMTLPDAGQGMLWSTADQDGTVYYYESGAAYTVTGAADFRSVTEAAVSDYRAYLAYAEQADTPILYADMKALLDAANALTVEPMAVGVPAAAARLDALGARAEAILADASEYGARASALAGIAHPKERMAEAVALGKLTPDTTCPGVTEAAELIRKALVELEALFDALDAYVYYAGRATELTVYADISGAITAAEALLPTVSPYRELYAEIAAADASLESARQRLAKIAGEAVAFLEAVSRIDLNADAANLRAAYEAAREVLYTGDMTVPGISEAFYLYNSADATVRSRDLIVEAFLDAVSKLDTSKNYAALAADLETASTLGALADVTADGVPAALEILRSAEAVLAAKTQLAQSYLAAAERLSPDFSYTERVQAVLAMEALGMTDLSYPGATDAKALADAERARLAAIDVLAESFSAAVSAFADAETLQARFDAYAVAYAYLADAAYDATHPTVAAAYAVLVEGAARYDREIDDANADMEEALVSVAMTVIAAERTPMTPILATIADIRSRIRREEESDAE